MQTILSCEHCKTSDFAPFLLLAPGVVESASERLWLQCLNCHDVRVIAVDPEVRDSWSIWHTMMKRRSEAATLDAAGRPESSRERRGTCNRNRQ